MGKPTKANFQPMKKRSKPCDYRREEEKRRDLERSKKRDLKRNY
jgi:hypothetical protein